MAYHAPTDLDDALALLAGAPIAVIAGGTDWFPANVRRPVTGDMLDLTRIEALRGIERGDGLRIGAAATWGELARMDLPPAYDGLRAAARVVGGIQIQNAGTVAGNICNASPAADGVPPLLALEAEVEIAGPNGARRLPLPEFVLGPRRTALRRGELLAAIHIPEPPTHARGAFEKVGARTYLVISIAMTAVVVGVADGVIDHARVAVGACGPVARRLEALERDLIGVRPGEVRVTSDHLAPLSPMDDVRADAAYRLEAAACQIERAVRRAAGG